MRRPIRSSASAPFALAALLIASLLLGACASGGSDGGASAEPAAEQTSEAAPVKGVAPPAGHRMAQVEMNMRPEEVRKIMGEPDSVKNYAGAIWKKFIPFYSYGADSGFRVEYGYKGEGRVVFAINQYSRQEKVVRIDYDPNETGE